MQDSWVIFWGNAQTKTYLYGSRIEWHDRLDVEFTNELMPPGTVIQQWDSQTSFQTEMTEPTLPIIDGEDSYELTADIDCDPGEQFLLRLVYFDRYGNEAGFTNIREKVTTFRCPLKTYSYRLQLINGGMTHFHFHSIVIRDISDGTDIQA